MREGYYSLCKEVRLLLVLHQTSNLRDVGELKIQSQEDTPKRALKSQFSDNLTWFIGRSKVKNKRSEKVAKLELE
jgi:hypothetical protein